MLVSWVILILKGRTSHVSILCDNDPKGRTSHVSILGDIDPEREDKSC